MKREIAWLKFYIFLSTFSIFGTFASALTGLNPGPIKPIASILTVLCGFMAVFAPFAKEIGNRRAVSACLVVFAIGVTSEIVGMYTGFPFGSYRYTDQWVPVVPLPGDHFFPLLLPFAWMMIAGASYFTCVRFGSWSVLAGAALATAVDLFMEPVMFAVLRYWEWTPLGQLFGAPTMNAFGWFLTAGLAGWALRRFEMNGKATDDFHPNAAYVLAIHLTTMAAIGTPHFLLKGA